MTLYFINFVHVFQKFDMVPRILTQLYYKIKKLN